MATRSPRRGPSAITPAPSWPSTSGCVSLASPIAPSSHQCRSEPQMPTAVTLTRLIPGPTSGAGSSATRRSPTAWSLAARTRSSSRRLHVIFIPNEWAYRSCAGCTPAAVRRPGPKTSDPRTGGRGSLARRGLQGARWTLGGWAGSQGHGRGVRLAGLVQPGDRDRIAGVVLDQRVGDVRGGGDRLAADRGDHVAGRQAGLGGGGPGHDLGDRRAGTALAAKAA